MASGSSWPSEPSVARNWLRQASHGPYNRSCTSVPHRGHVNPNSSSPIPGQCHTWHADLATGCTCRRRAERDGGPRGRACEADPGARLTQQPACHNSRGKLFFSARTGWVSHRLWATTPGGPAAMRRSASGRSPCGRLYPQRLMLVPTTSTGLCLFLRTGRSSYVVSTGSESFRHRSKPSEPARRSESRRTSCRRPLAGTPTCGGCGDHFADRRR
jgi:hypothetical protein